MIELDSETVSWERDDHEPRKGTARLRCDRELYFALPRDEHEPCVHRWALGQLLYYRVAQEVQSPCHPVELCALGGRIGIASDLWGHPISDQRFGTKHCLGDWMSRHGYNVTHFLSAENRAFFSKVSRQFRSILVADQLLRMRDRTPHNLVYRLGDDGDIELIRSIDHKWCLGYPEGRPPEDERCHPTQITHLFVDPSEAREAVLAEGELALERMSTERYREISAEVCEGLVRDLRSLGRKVDIRRDERDTTAFFERMRETLLCRLRDFIDNYAPLLVERGLLP